MDSPGPCPLLHHHPGSACGFLPLPGLPAFSACLPTWFPSVWIITCLLCYLPLLPCLLFFSASMPFCMHCNTASHSPVHAWLRCTCGYVAFAAQRTLADCRSLPRLPRSPHRARSPRSVLHHTHCLTYYHTPAFKHTSRNSYAPRFAVHACMPFSCCTTSRGSVVTASDFFPVLRMAYWLTYAHLWIHCALFRFWPARATLHFLCLTDAILVRILWFTLRRYKFWFVHCHAACRITASLRAISPHFKNTPFHCLLSTCQHGAVLRDHYSGLACGSRARFPPHRLRFIKRVILAGYPITYRTHLTRASSARMLLPPRHLDTWFTPFAVSASTASTASLHRSYLDLVAVHRTGSHIPARLLPHTAYRSLRKPRTRRWLLKALCVLIPYRNLLGILHPALLPVSSLPFTRFLPHRRCHVHVFSVLVRRLSPRLQVCLRFSGFAILLHVLLRTVAPV